MKKKIDYEDYKCIQEFAVCDVRNDNIYNIVFENGRKVFFV